MTNSRSKRGREEEEKRQGQGRGETWRAGMDDKINNKSRNAYLARYRYLPVSVYIVQLYRGYRGCNFTFTYLCILPVADLHVYTIVSQLDTTTLYAYESVQVCIPGYLPGTQNIGLTLGVQYR